MIGLIKNRGKLEGVGGLPACGLAVFGNELKAVHPHVPGILALTERHLDGGHLKGIVRGKADEGVPADLADVPGEGREGRGHGHGGVLE